jgi:flagellar protein FliT
MTMMTSHEILAVYDSMAAISGHMLQAATDSDWDRLVVLEQQCAACVRRLQDHGPQALEGAEREQKLGAIRKILEDDRKIRDLTMPWMAKLSALISNTGTERRLARAYGAV